MQSILETSCPYCGEAVEVTVDPAGAPSENYVEDCPVCCRPWQVQVIRGEDDLDETQVILSREDD